MSQSLFIPGFRLQEGCGKFVVLLTYYCYVIIAAWNCQENNGKAILLLSACRDASCFASIGWGQRRSHVLRLDLLRRDASCRHMLRGIVICAEPHPDLPGDWHSRMSASGRRLAVPSTCQTICRLESRIAQW